MSQRRGKSERVDLGAEVAGFRSGGLGGGLLAAGGVEGAAGVGNDGAGATSSPVTPSLSPEGALGGRGVVRLRLSKAGRGGHAVTLLESEALVVADEGARVALARALGEALGCRAWWGEGERAVCLQGDQRGRVRGWLVGRGVEEGRIKNA